MFGACREMRLEYWRTKRFNCTRCCVGLSVIKEHTEMLKKELLDIIACPKCKGDLEYDQKNQKLICHACRLKYHIEDDIPIMLIDEAEKF